MKALLFLAAILATVALAYPNYYSSSSSSSTYMAPLIENTDAEMIPDEYIVIFKDEALRREDAAHLIDSVLATGRVQESALIHRYFNGFAAALTQRSLELIRSRTEIEFIEANQVVYAHGAQMDPPSWGLARISQRQFRTRKVYNYPDTAGKDVDVYIIDTGVMVSHEDFEGRAVWGFTAPVGDGDVDGNGHGTHVASTVAGKAFGVAKKANIIAVKVLRSSGFGTTADVVAGINWAAEKAKASKKRSAANMSLGGGRSAAMDLSVAKAIESGLSFAVAAGNSNADACRFSPAAVETAVTVVSSNSGDSRSYFSNHGKCTDIVAPGEDITGAWIGSNTAKRTISGTSMASPHVAGVMALFLAERAYTPADLKSKLLETSTADSITGLPTGTPNYLLHNTGVDALDSLYY